MAQHSSHPIAAAPAPPARERTARLWLHAYCVLVLVLAMCMGALNNLVGPEGVALVLSVCTVVTVLIWTLSPIIRRATAQSWPRAPWAFLGYAALAGLSILWSAWPAVSAATWFALMVTTAHGVFLAVALTWREVVRALVSACRWVLGLSLGFELFVSVVLRHPVLPPFLGEVTDPSTQLYWSRDNLFTSGRIQGIVGNSNLLGMICVLALIVFVIAALAGLSRRGVAIAWLIVTLFLLVRVGSATAAVIAFAVLLVAAAAIAVRRSHTLRARRNWYVLFGAVAVTGLAAALIVRDRLFELLGRGGDLTGRGEIWSQVIERANQRPAFGWGFATPWLPWDPHFDGWIIDHGLSVFHAHDMWVDVYLQLGFVGVVVIAAALFALVWRAWFLAVDRPRWDIESRRAFSPLSLLPILVVAALLVQGITESRPLMEWGWLLIVLLATKTAADPVLAGEPIAAPRRRRPRPGASTPTPR